MKKDIKEYKEIVNVVADIQETLNTISLNTRKEKIIFLKTLKRMIQSISKKKLEDLQDKLKQQKQYLTIWKNFFNHMEIG